LQNDKLREGMGKIHGYSTQAEISEASWTWPLCAVLPTDSTSSTAPLAVSPSVSLYNVHV